MKYSNEEIEKLNNSLKIEEVIGEFVNLKKVGANFKGLCPFHRDTNPSFMVNPVKNICKCFVCNEGGNPITFYSNYKKISFEEAVEELSKKYNIPLEGKGYINKKNTEEYEIYYEIIEKAKKYFSEEIFKNSGREALNYLVNRGITPENILKNSIGFAPNSRNKLSEFLLNEGYPLEKIMDVGLVKEGDNGLYDVFRNRIIFPIYSLDRRVIAFGGRTLESDKDVAKYINSPDTPIFKKGNVLYGLGEKFLNIKQKGYAMLMEGYMDVLMATLNGFDVTLAPLGTALTEEQGKLLKRYTKNIILSFDMDPPGQKATEKAILILKELGFSIRVLMFENAKDPDEYIKKYGKEEFLKVIKNSSESFDFLYKFYAKEYDLNDLFSKQNFIKRFKEFFQKVSDKIEQSLYIDKLAVNTGIEKEILWETLVEKNRAVTKKNISNYESEIIEKEKPKNLSLEIEFLTTSLVLVENSYYKYFNNKQFDNNLVKKIFKFFEENQIGVKEIKFEDLLKSEIFTESEKYDVLTFSLLNYGPYSEKETREELLIELLTEWLRKELKEIKKVEKKDIVLLLEIKKIEQKIAKKCTLEEIKTITEELENKKLSSRYGGVL
ncbi:MAG: DNA primase [Fusobacteriaceae bacterium]|nr:DNA primase [Fusobacteriaceae bacterium]MBP9510527.1 DNA primase [Fusobacteriaceae bacterium]